MFIILALVFLMGASVPASAFTSSSALSAGSSSVGGLTTKDTARNLAKGLLHAATFVVVCAINLPRVLVAFYARNLLYLDALAVRSEELTMVGFMKKHPVLSAWVGKTTVQHVIEAVNGDPHGYELRYLFKSLGSDLWMLPYKMAKQKTALWFDGIKVNYDDVRLRRPAREGTIQADLEEAFDIRSTLDAWWQHLPPSHDLPAVAQILDDWHQKLEGQAVNLHAGLVKLNGLFQGCKEPAKFANFCQKRLYPVLQQLHKVSEPVLLRVADLSREFLGNCHDHAALLFMRIETTLAVQLALVSLPSQDVRAGNPEVLQQVKTQVQGILTHLLHEYHLDVLQRVGGEVIINFEKSLKQFGVLESRKTLDVLEEFMVMYQLITALIHHRPLVDLGTHIPISYQAILEKAYADQINPNLALPEPAVRLNFEQLKQSLMGQHGKDAQSNAGERLQTLPHQKYPYTSYLLRPGILAKAQTQYRSAGEEQKKEFIEPSLMTVFDLVLCGWLKAATQENMVDYLAQHADWQAVLRALMPTEPSLALGANTEQNRLSVTFTEFKEMLGQHHVQDKTQNFSDPHKAMEWLDEARTENRLNDGQYAALAQALQADVKAANEAQLVQVAEHYKAATKIQVLKHPSMKMLDALRSERADNPQPKDPEEPSANHAATSKAA